MIGIGTLVNASAIATGGILGTFFRKALSERFKETIMQGIGLAVLAVGMSGVLQGIFKITTEGRLDRQYLMVMIFSLVAGGLLGEAINLEKKMKSVGDWFQSRFSTRETRFSEGFVSASLLYCVGAMAIVGALEDGLAGNPSTLFAKSILDGVTAILFSASMGIGVAFSAFPVLIYQGSITLLAGLVKPLLSDVLVSQISLTGSLLIFAIGLNLLNVTKIKVGNLLPAVFMPLLFHGVWFLIRIVLPS